MEPGESLHTLSPIQAGGATGGRRNHGIIDPGICQPLQAVLRGVIFIVKNSLKTYYNSLYMD